MPDMSRAELDVARRLRRLLIGVLTAIVVVGSVDLALDRPSTWRSAHVLIEVVLVLGAAVASLLLGRGWLAAERSLVTTRAELERHRVEREAWRTSAQTAVVGLQRAIEAQFVAWQLTDAEQDVAWLLLQGHSHKVIANRTGRSERTVRQHAVSAYAKSGLRGRAELSAFFLDDLLVPGDVDRDFGGDEE